MNFHTSFILSFSLFEKMLCYHLLPYEMVYAQISTLDFATISTKLFKDVVNCESISFGLECLVLISLSHTSETEGNYRFSFH